MDLYIILTVYYTIVVHYKYTLQSLRGYLVWASFRKIIFKISINLNEKKFPNIFPFLTIDLYIILTVYYTIVVHYKYTLQSLRGYLVWASFQKIIFEISINLYEKKFSNIFPFVVIDLYTIIAICYIIVVYYKYAL